MTFLPLSDIVGPFKLALTETNPHSGGQRGARTVEAPHDTRRLYHSRAARDDRAGAFPLQEVTSGQLSRCAPSAAASCSTLCRTCRRALPDRSFGLRVLRLSCRASLCLWQAGWNRGTYDSASPLTHSGVRRFFAVTPPHFYRGARRMPPPQTRRRL